MKDLTASRAVDSHRSGDTPQLGSLTQGVEVTATGTRYRVWSEHPAVSLIIYREDGTVARTIRMEPVGGGFFTASDQQGRAGDLYKYQFRDFSFPDPTTRFQPHGVHGPSIVVANQFRWTDDNWESPPLRDLIIYELHLGTFTGEGTFTAAAQKLAELTQLGINAIEIMPVADFPGGRNWGYDGVCAYAPARVYGTPDEFRKLIDTAHAHGLAIILDVVYNHFGPEGNYLAAFHSQYFHPSHKTPWGAAFNFELPPVRHFFLNNIAYWMDEFHVDGFRLDATHAIVDSTEIPILKQVAAVAHSRGGFVIAEDDRNDPQLESDPAQGGFGLDGCWADDFHHVVNVMLTGNRDAYFANYNGTAEELAVTLERGWLFSGQVQKTTGRVRGGDPTALKPEQLVYCISNHDQVGNRAFGERFSHLTSPAAYRAASALLLLAPYTPLMFMGQEWAASTPFQYFTDHEPELGEKVIIGRRYEFRDFTAYRDARVRETIPSPQAEETFLRSKLNWSERDQTDKSNVLNLYQTCIKLRKEVPALKNRARDNWRIVRLDGGVIAIVYGGTTEDCCIVVSDLTGAGFSIDDVARKAGMSGRLERLFASNDEAFGGSSDAGSKQPQTTLLLER